MVNEIKNLRIEIDGLAKLTKELKPLEKGYNADIGEFGKNSKEIEKAVDSLYLAKAWLGIMMKELGESTPYANDGKRKTVEDIEFTVDVATNETLAKGGIAVAEYVIFPHWESMNHVEKVDHIRELIKEIIDNTTDFSEHIPYIELEQGFVYKYLCEARFWLGWEFSRIRDAE